jgi:hypothetical protein
MAADLRAGNSAEATSFMGTVASTVEVDSTAAGVGNESAYMSGKAAGRVDLLAVFFFFVGLARSTA